MMLEQQKRRLRTARYHLEAMSILDVQDSQWHHVLKALKEVRMVLIEEQALLEAVEKVEAEFTL